MIILFGFRRTRARLGTILVMCGFCHTPAAHAIQRIRKFFTLFFIPVIPLGTKYATTCTMCGRSALITKEAAETYVAAAAQGVPSSGVPAPPEPAFAHADATSGSGALASTSGPGNVAQSPGVIYCSWCGTQRAVDSPALHHCGSMERPAVYCMSCGTSFEEGAANCASCGTSATQVSR